MSDQVLESESSIVSYLKLLWTVVAFSSVGLCGEPPTELAKKVIAEGKNTLQALPAATPDHLPRWRGFNLLEKFHRDWSNKTFREEDFSMIHELGFNFVRLPMDYRVWIVDGDWTRFNESVLSEIDQAVVWGARYGIHVCINFHRAPGYTVNTPKEPTDLWTHAETQRICALHWQAFAKRYRGVPNKLLSFNLMNEPAEVSGPNYAKVVDLLFMAIHAEDPNRLVIADGIEYGAKPCKELIGHGVAQATRGYSPFEVTHYRASWVPGSEAMPIPKWPMIRGNGLLGGPDKPKQQGPIRLDGPFTGETKLRMHLAQVSVRCRLVVEADGKPIFDHAIVCKEGKGEWVTSLFDEKWQCWQASFDKDYLTAIPAGTEVVTINNIDGDWLQLSELGLTAGKEPEQTVPLAALWDQPHVPLQWKGMGAGSQISSADRTDKEWLRRTTLAPWLEIAKQKTGIMVGEFGVHNRTPHDVTLAWLTDALANWKDAEMGWALWNFRGSFGVLDSDRSDVKYEDWRGHKLDRAMLEILQRN